jgi:hypothetical protein
MAKVRSNLRPFHVPIALPFPICLTRDSLALTLSRRGVFRSRYLGSWGKSIGLRNDDRKYLVVKMGPNTTGNTREHLTIVAGLLG